MSGTTEASMQTLAPILRDVHRRAERKFRPEDLAKSFGLTGALEVETLEAVLDAEYQRGKIDGLKEAMEDMRRINEITERALKP
jgi:hypothetical protein